MALSQERGIILKISEYLWLLLLLLSMALVNLNLSKNIRKCLKLTDAQKSPQMWRN